MMATVWRVGRTGERMVYRTGWGHVSGEWGEQQTAILCMEYPSRQLVRKRQNEREEKEENTGNRNFV